MKHKSKETFDVGLNVSPSYTPSAPVTGDVWNNGTRLTVKTAAGNKNLATTDDIAAAADLTALNVKAMAYTIALGGL